MFIMKQHLKASIIIKPIHTTNQYFAPNVSVQYRAQVKLCRTTSVYNEMHLERAITLIRRME